VPYPVSVQHLLVNTNRAKV